MGILSIKTGERRIKAAILIICFIATLSFVACSSSEDIHTYSTSGRDERRMGYETEYYLFGSDTDRYIGNIFKNEQCLFIDTVNIYDDENESPTVDHTVYKIDIFDGSVLETQIDQTCNIRCAVGNSYYSTDGTLISKYDMLTGSLVSVTESAIGQMIYDMISVSDGYLIISDGAVYHYDDSDKLQGMIRDNKLSGFAKDPVFESDEGIYVICESGNEFVYYLLDFEEESLRRTASSSEFGAYLQYIDGNYICDGYQISKIDITNEQIFKLADFNLIDIKPEEGRLSIPSDIRPLDDDHFAVVYSYTSGNIELQLFTYDPEQDTQFDSQLVIGGYGCKDDLILRWAVYDYNLENEMTRAVIVDYANEEYGYSDGVAAEQARLALIKEFNSGNAPDIFYGDAFDYGYFGRNGMVINMMPYITSDSGFDPNRLTLAAQNLMFNDDGTCYQAFASYMIDGFFIQGSIIDEISIEALASDNTTNNSSLYPAMTYAQLLDTIIRYELPRRYATESDHCFTKDELIEAIEYSVNNSYPSLSEIYANGSGSDDSVLSLALIGDAHAYASYYSGQYFAGYPTLGGTNRIAKPYGLMAISANCTDPQEAWKLVRGIFDDKIQEICIANWSFPVTCYSAELYRAYLADPDIVPDDLIVLGFLREYESMRKDDIDAYFESMESVTDIQTNDWGIFNIISDEMLSYINGKPIPEVAESLQSRLDTYASENYG